jgi:hypothetical protein
MELTMYKSSTLTLVAPVLAVLAGATFAHAYLLSPAPPADAITMPTSPMVTIVHGGIGKTALAQIEIPGRPTRPVTLAQTEPEDGGAAHRFGPRGLPLRPRSGAWRDAAFNLNQTGSADRPVAETADAADITCNQVWARPTAGATTGAVYFTLTNHGEPDELIGASTPIAASAGVHQTFSDNGVVKMRPVPNFALAPDKPVKFTPGGYHVMLMGLKSPLKVGDSFPLTLSFSHAQAITVTVQVAASGAAIGNAPMPSMPGMR